MSERETAAEIDQAANRWLWQREAADWTPEQAAELQAWLAVSSARQGAFLRAEAAWASLDRLNWASTPHTPTVMKRRWWIGGGVAVAALIAVALLLPQDQRYVSPKREVRAVALKDGSAVTLNADTDLRADMDGRHREINLKSGEAFFKVRPDHARPFVVAAGRMRVRAVGTAFAVTNHSETPRVIVTEGVVEVWLTDQPEARTRVVAGQAVAVSGDGAVLQALASVETAERQLAWRQGRIDLNGETLADAVRRFNTYNQVQLVVSDPNLRNQRLYGVFDMHDPAAFAKTAGTVLEAPVRSRGGEIYIGQKATP